MPPAVPRQPETAGGFVPPPLPRPWRLRETLSPGLLLVALAPGLGALFFWPRAVLALGPGSLLLLAVGLSLQLVVRVETARYTLATGESVLSGLARLHPLLAWLVWVLGWLVVAWPGAVVLSGLALEQALGHLLSWEQLALAGLVAIGLLLTRAPRAYGSVQAWLLLLSGLLVVLSTLAAVLVGGPGEWGAALAGLLGLGWSAPPEPTGGESLAALGVLALAGLPGLQHAWYSLYLRDCGAGMAAHGLQAQSVVGGVESVPSVGRTLDATSESELQRWSEWRHWSMADSAALFLSPSLLLGIVFAVLAVSAAAPGGEAGSPGPSGVLEGLRSAVSGPLGGFGGSLFLALVATSAWRTAFDGLDALARAQAEIIWQSPSAGGRRRFDRLYYLSVCLALALNAAVIATQIGRSAVFVLDALALVSSLALGVYCILLAATNHLLLPTALRPGRRTTLVLLIAGLVYLGAFVLVLWAGAAPAALPSEGRG